MTSPPCWDLKVGSGWAPCENTDRKPETALRPSPDPLDRDDDGQHALRVVQCSQRSRPQRSPEAREPGPDRSSQMHEPRIASQTADCGGRARDDVRRTMFGISEATGPSTGSSVGDLHSARGLQQRWHFCSRPGNSHRSVCASSAERWCQQQKGRASVFDARTAP